MKTLRQHRRSTLTTLAAAFATPAGVLAVVGGLYLQQVSAQAPRYGVTGEVRRTTAGEYLINYVRGLEQNPRPRLPNLPIPDYRFSIG